jgi:hypothetical protein
MTSRCQGHTLSLWIILSFLFVQHLELDFDMTSHLFDVPEVLNLFPNVERIGIRLESNLLVGSSHDELENIKPRLYAWMDSHGEP